MKLIDAIKKQNLKGVIESATGFTYRPKKGFLERGKNCAFRLDDRTAWSYSWWCFFRIIDGHAVFNKHRYSVTTAKHQNDMRDLLSTLGIYPTIYVDTRKSLSSMNLADVRAALIKELDGIKTQLAQCKRPSKKKDRLETRRDSLLWDLEEIDGKPYNSRPVKVVERDASEWGAPDIGVHRLDPDERALADAFETAERDGFETIYVYRTKVKKGGLKLVVGGDK